MSSTNKGITRRDFVRTAAAVSAAAGTFPRFAWGAANEKPLTIGLIGCGGRGTSASINAMTADKNVKIAAMADIAKDRQDKCRKDLNDKFGLEIQDSMCFIGQDAYKKMMETKVDYVILATPPHYRPLHFAAAVAAGKNVFMEKPVAVDPVGIRKVIATGEVAKSKGLCVVAGTQRRHQNGYIETIKLIKKGAIGQIVAAQCYWNQKQLWYRVREEGEKPMAWMHRDWVNWCWLSGDHIVEQHVHNLDVINWAIGTHPTKVVSFGSRQRRINGDQYDNFSSDFTYPGEDANNDIHVHSMCRQINECANAVSERIVGQKGISNCNGMISTLPKIEYEKNKPFEQEHKDLIDAIRSGKAINEAKNVAESTLTAIMARTSAYTGQEVTWEEIMKSDLQLGPPDYELTVANCLAHVPVPGKEKQAS